MNKPKHPMRYALSKAKILPVSKTESGKTVQRVYALCMDKKGRIISESSNYYDKSHPYQYECACEAGNDEAIYLHAEIAAIVKAKKKSIYKIVIARVGNTDESLPSKPCKICQIAIDLANIEVVEYTV